MRLRLGLIMILGLTCLAGCQTSNSAKSKHSVNRLMGVFIQERQFAFCLGDTALSVNAALGKPNVSLANLGIDDKCLNSLLPKLRLQKKMVSLDLSNNKIANEGLVNLLLDLQGQHLKSLNLSNNRITGVSAVALGTFLLTHGNVNSLILSNNALGDRGACLLIQSLQQRTALRQLDLRRVNIGAEGAACALAMAEHGALPETLLLDGNDLSGLTLSDVNAVADTHLKHLSLDSTQLDSQASRSLAQLLPHLTALQHFSLADNALSDDAVALVSQAVSVHPAITHWNMQFSIVSNNAEAQVKKVSDLKPGITIQQ